MCCVMLGCAVSCWDGGDRSVAAGLRNKVGIRIGVGESSRAKEKLRCKRGCAGMCRGSGGLSFIH